MKIFCRLFGHKWRSPDKPFTKCERCGDRKPLPSDAEIQKAIDYAEFQKSIIGRNRTERRRNRKKNR